MYNSETQNQASFLDQHIGSLGLSYRSEKCLRLANIICVSDLIQKTENELLKIKNLGRKSLAELKSVLAEKNFTLRDIHTTPPILLEKKIIKQGDDQYVNLLIPVKELDFCERTLKCLQINNINYVGDLVQKTKADLLRIRNFGQKCYCEIQSKLKEIGLCLDMPVLDWTPIKIKEAEKFYNKEIEKKHLEFGKKFYKTIETKTTTLEDELSYLAEVAGRKRNKDIIIGFYGWDGQGPKTLETAGEKFGITRERVRQICNKFEKRLAGLQSKFSYLTKLDAALQCIEENLPETTDNIELKLRNQGIIKEHFDIEGLLTAAKILKRKIFFTVITLNQKSFVLKPVSGKILRQIVSFARNSISKRGVSNLAEIAALINEKTGQKVDLKLVASALSTVDGFSWLDQESGWFWISKVPRNRLLNQIKKILSIAKEIEIGEMRSCIGRFQRMAGFSPPRRVLLDLCQQLSWCQVKESHVFADPPLDWEKTLEGKTELIMATILKEYGPIMAVSELEKMCLESGINKNTFIAYLNSPIITRHTIGIYSLCGAKIPPGQVELLNNEKKRNKIIKDYGWTSDGKIWLAIKLTPGLIRSGVFSVPSSLKKFLQGQFSLIDGDEKEVNNISIKNTMAWSLGPFFSRRGGDIGDFFIGIFDLQAHKVKAYLGEKDLIDDLIGLKKTN